MRPIPSTRTTLVTKKEIVRDICERAKDEKLMKGGLTQLAKQRKVTVVSGAARFISETQVEVDNAGAKSVISFDHAIIAAGSEPVTLPFIPHGDPRVIDSTGALEMQGVPKRLVDPRGG